MKTSLDGNDGWEIHTLYSLYTIYSGCYTRWILQFVCSCARKSIERNTWKLQAVRVPPIQNQGPHKNAFSSLSNLVLYVCVCVCLCVCVRVRMCQFSFPKARLWECLKKLTMPKPKQRWTSLFMGHQPFVMQSRSRRCLEFQIQPPRSSSPNLSDHESRRAQSSQLATSDWNPGSQAAQKLGKWGRNLLCTCAMHNSVTPAYEVDA